MAELLMSELENAGLGNYFEQPDGFVQQAAIRACSYQPRRGEDNECCQQQRTAFRLLVVHGCWRSGSADCVGGLSSAKPTQPNLACSRNTSSAIANDA
jgi:hypothetical protein